MGCSVSDLMMISVVDLNVPFAKAKENLDELCRSVQFLNDLAPDFHCGLIEIPQMAKKSSRRGIADEETDLQQKLWGLRQICDERWFPSGGRATQRRGQQQEQATCSTGQNEMWNLFGCGASFLLKLGTVGLGKRQKPVHEICLCHLRRYQQGRIVCNKDLKRAMSGWDRASWPCVAGP